MWILIVLLISLFARIYSYAIQNPIWDSSVYILMGKYIYSSGTVGLWEPFRPILWPVVLGFFWNLGGDPILWGSALEMLFSLGSIYILYLIGKLVFGEKIGIIAAILLSFSPTYFIWGNCLYTRIPATFFGLLSLYSFLKNRDFSSGIFLGVAFLTNFSLLLLFIPLFLGSFFRYKKKGNIFIASEFVLGFALVFMPFLIFNSIIYKNPFYPFMAQSQILTAYSFYWHNDWLYYLKHLATKESFFSLFYLAGIFFVIKKARNWNSKKITVVLSGFIFLIFTNAIRTQQLRYLIVCLPYIYLLSAYGMIEIYGYLKDKTWVTRIAFYILIVTFALFELKQLKDSRFPSEKYSSFPKKKLNSFQRYIKDNEPKIKESIIWISDPSMLVHSNLKASQLIYYPVFNANRARDLQKELDSADLILFDDFGLRCTPQNDVKCESEKRRLLEKIWVEFDAVVYRKNQSGELVAGIFKRNKSQVSPPDVKRE